MLKWTIKPIELKLKYTWAISNASISSKTNYEIKVTDDSYSGIGEVAFNSRGGESEKQILEAFEGFSSEFPEDMGGVESLIQYLDMVELPNSLRFGIESAYLHYLSHISEREVQQLLGVNKVSSSQTSFSLPILSINKIKGFLEEHKLERFDSLKIKIDSVGGVDACKEVMANFSGRIRIDANEAFSNPVQVMKFLEVLGEHNRIDFIEQPMPSSCHQEYLELKKSTPVQIFADESLQGGAVNDYFIDRFHGVNIKLMKAGGYLKALKQLKDAKRLGLKTMLGCMVESSLGISSGLNIAHGFDFIDLDGFLFLEKDPYGLLIEERGKIFYAHFH